MKKYVRAVLDDLKSKAGKKRNYVAPQDLDNQKAKHAVGAIEQAVGKSRIPVCGSTGCELQADQHGKDKHGRKNRVTRYGPLAGC